MRRFLGISLVSAVVVFMPVRASDPSDVGTIPVVWESPGCEHDKLGSIEIEAGQRVNELTGDTNVPTVDYARAMSKLSDAGQERGANAVVLRWHQGVYFTRNGKQTRKPVYVKLRGAAIRVAAPARCTLQLVDATELEERSRSGKPVDVSSREAFASD